MKSFTNYAGKRPDIMKIIPFEQQLSTIWSGGTTTQLYISPVDAVYSNRDFKLRISSASIDVSSSDFTPLPGYDRILMVLDGELNITHEGHHSCFLKPYETDYFKGDWKTSAKGLATDFNIIFKPELKPKLSSKTLNTGDHLFLSNSGTMTILFIHKGSGTLNTENQQYDINPLDTCICEQSQDLTFTANEPTVVLEISID